jgi:hypothetical protein
MSIRKFHSVEEMPGPSPLPRLDPENLRIAFGLSSLANRLSPARRRPGVRKFHSWDEALAAKEADAIPLGSSSDRGWRRPRGSGT